MISWPSHSGATLVATHSINIITPTKERISNQSQSGCVRELLPYQWDLRPVIKKLAKIPTTPQDSSASEYESEKEVYANTSESLASLNQCLGEIGETPVSKHKLQ